MINVGIAAFARSIADNSASVLQLDWRPVGDGDPETALLLAQLAGDESDPDALGSRIDKANTEAAQRMIAARPMLVDVALHARDVWSDMGKTLLHAGAPIAWEKMCGPMRGAMIGAVLYEGWADSAEAARAQLARGEYKFSPCHRSKAVGPMAGVISSSMPLFVVRNETHGNYAYTNMSEGIGKVLRFGANSQSVVDHLRWIECVLAPGSNRPSRRSPAESTSSRSSRKHC